MALLSSKFTNNPANYLYLFADYNKFIKYLSKDAQAKISAKKVYQKKVIVNEVTNDNYDAALKELYDAFINIYGITPAQALVDLANGKTVAGKNWSEGVSGIGAIKVNTFANNKNITVDPETGAISDSGSVVSSNSTAIIGTNKKHNNVIGYTYTDENGNCYTSQYNKVTGKYYCGTKTDANGNVTLGNGKTGSNADMNSIWSSIISDLTDFLRNILDKLAEKLTNGQTLLTSVDVAPEQKDGFETTDDGSNVLPWLIGGAAALAIAAPSLKKAIKK